MTVCGISSALPLVHLEAVFVPKKEEDWGKETLVVLHNRLLVPGNPCNLLPLAAPWKLLVSIV